MNPLLKICQTSLLILLFALVYTTTLGQAILNFSFEKHSNQNKPLVFWSSRKGETYLPRIDTLVYRDGKASLLFDARQNLYQSPILFYTRSLPIETLRNKIVVFSAFVKVENFTGKAGLYASVLTDQVGDRLAQEAKADSVFEENSWKKISLKVPVGAQATHIALGLQIKGTGKVWFDQIEVAADSDSYLDAPLPGTEPFLADSVTYNWAGLGATPLNKTLPDGLLHVRFDSARGQAENPSWLLTSKTTKAGERASGILKILPLDTLWGKKLTVKGDFKVENGDQKKAFLYLSFLSQDDHYCELYRYQEYSLDSLATTSGWNSFSIEADIPATSFVKAAVIGFTLTGQENIRISDLRTYVDNQLYDGSSNPIPPLRANEIQWLKTNSLSLQSVAPSEKLADLSPLSEIVGDARIVGLGEVSHGSSEIFQMKHRLFQFLVEKKGFRMLAMEAGMADAEKVNDYVLEGKGLPKEVLKKLGFWTWNTQEILDMLLWMRHYNQQHPTERVQFAGVDMQSPLTSLENLLRYARRYDTTMIAEITQLEVVLAEIGRRHSRMPPSDAVQANAGLASIEQHMELNKPAHLVSLQVLSWLKQHLTLIKQWVALKVSSRGNDYRDACMAENLLWIAQQHPQVKIAMWAHNAHVARKYGLNHPMGEWLKEHYGKSYLAFGFAFNEGSYRAQSKGEIQSVHAQKAYPGSFEGYFELAQSPILLLNLKAFSLNKENQWLFQRHFFREAGAVAPETFERHDLIKEFDVLVYIQQSTSAQEPK